MATSRTRKPDNTMSTHPFPMAVSRVPASRVALYKSGAMLGVPYVPGTTLGIKEDSILDGDGYFSADPVVVPVKVERFLRHSSESQRKEFCLFCAQQGLQFLCASLRGYVPSTEGMLAQFLPQSPEFLTDALAWVKDVRVCLDRDSGAMSSRTEPFSLSFVRNLFRLVLGTFDPGAEDLRPSREEAKVVFTEALRISRHFHREILQNESHFLKEVISFCASRDTTAPPSRELFAVIDDIIENHLTLEDS